MDARAERDKVKATCIELVTMGLPSLDEHERITLLAAVSSLAKWSAAAAVAEFVDARKLATQH